MALTIINQPQKFSPAYNDLIFVVDSTNKAQTNFKYIGDLYFAGSSTPDARIKLFPRPDGYGVFNFKDVVKSYVNTDIAITASPNEGFKQNTNSYKAFTVQFGEEYGTIPILTANLATSGTIYAHNSIVDFLDFQNYNQTAHLLAAATTRKFLTDSPATKTIRSTESEWLYFMTDTSGTCYKAVIGTSTDNGLNYSYSDAFVNSFQAVTAANDRFVRIPSGIANINKAGATYISGSVTNYKIYLASFNSVATSETKTFNVENVCTQHTVYRFHFLNKWGGFDSFSFIRRANKSTSVARTKFKKLVGTLTSGVWGYNKSDRGDINFSTTLKDKITVNSDWITEIEQTWLEQLITSPEVYQEIDSELIAVNILNSTYETKVKVDTKLFNIILEFEYSYNRYRQTY